MKLVEAGSKILFSRVGQVLANAAVVMIVAHILGPEGQGHYSLTVALVMLLASLLGGGMGLAAVPPLRQEKIRPQRMLAAQLGWTAAMVLVLIGLAATSTGGRLAGLLGRHLGWSDGVGYLAALAAVGILGFETFSYDLLARGRLVVGAAVNGVRATGHLGLVAALALGGALTFERTVGAFAVAQFCGMAMVLKRLRPVMPSSTATTISPAAGPRAP